MQTTDVSLSNHLLLVEDDKATAIVMKRLMSTVDVAVEHASTLEAGLAALSRIPQVAVLDLTLPDGCGVEVLEAIRAANLRCKVAIVTGATDPKLFERVRAAQPDAIFRKPIDFQDFVEWLCEAFPESSAAAA